VYAVSSLSAAAVSDLWLLFLAQQASLPVVVPRMLSPSLQLMDPLLMLFVRLGECCLC